jgi:hypothetical protein
MLTRTKPPVKPYRIAPKPLAPFAAGLDAKPVPPEPTVDPMPQRVRWVAVDLTPLEDLVSPEPTLTLSGSWAMPGEDWSWEIGFTEID